MRARRPSAVVACAVAAAFVVTACSEQSAGSAGAAGERDAVVITGSATIEPITRMAVRESGTNAQISSEGSNNGFEKFCAGESDINNASTPIPGPEDPVDFRAACADNGVEYVELPIALDAIVLIANEQNEAVRDITMAELRRIWEPGSSVDTWSDVRDGWPGQEIDLFGRSGGSGTFLEFTQKVNGEPGAIREDYEHSADLAQVAHWAAEAPYSLAFMGVGNYLAAPEEDRNRVTTLPVGGVAPDRESVVSGRYPLGRELYVYVSREALGKNPAVEEYARHLLEHGQEIVPRAFFYPLSDDAYAQARARLDERVLGPR